VNRSAIAAKESFRYSTRKWRWGWKAIVNDSDQESVLVVVRCRATTKRKGNKPTFPCLKLMAKTTEVETAVRRSKRYQPLVGPLGSAIVADGSVQWLGEPRHVRETVSQDILEDEREDWDSDDEGETSFYDAFTRPRTGATVLSGARDGERSRKGKKMGKGKEADVQTFSIGDTVLVATVTAVPSVAVIVSMWETSATAGRHVKVHWFLRPKELASIRAKRDYVEVSGLLIPTDTSC
jgi:hypothetical protein